MINVTKTSIAGVFVIEPKVFGDERGYFLESFNAKEFKEKTGIDVTFIQDNQVAGHQEIVHGSSADAHTECHHHQFLIEFPGMQGVPEIPAQRQPIVGCEILSYVFVHSHMFAILIAV